MQENGTPAGKRSIKVIVSGGFEVVNFVATTRRWYDRGKPREMQEMRRLPKNPDARTTDAAAKRKRGGFYMPKTNALADLSAGVFVYKKEEKPMKNNSIDLSLPKDREVRGYTIKKAPLGAFLQALQKAQDFPARLMDSVFPGQNLAEILGTLKNCDSDMIGTVLARALVVAPEMVVSLVASLTGIPETKLKNDPNIGAAGLIEIIKAWTEVNDIENFMQTARDLFRRGKTLAGTGNAGCKN